VKGVSPSSSALLLLLPFLHLLPLLGLLMLFLLLLGLLPAFPAAAASPVISSAADNAWLYPSGDAAAALLRALAFAEPSSSDDECSRSGNA
jgi:hypothetical protein